MHANLLTVFVSLALLSLPAISAPVVTTQSTSASSGRSPSHPSDHPGLATGVAQIDASAGANGLVTPAGGAQIGKHAINPRALGDEEYGPSTPLLTEGPKAKDPPDAPLSSKAVKTLREKVTAGVSNWKKSFSQSFQSFDKEPKAPLTSVKDNLDVPSSENPRKGPVAVVPGQTITVDDNMALAGLQVADAKAKVDEAKTRANTANQAAKKIKTAAKTAAQKAEKAEEAEKRAKKMKVATGAAEAEAAEAKVKASEAESEAKATALKEAKEAKTNTRALGKTAIKEHEEYYIKLMKAFNAKHGAELLRDNLAKVGIRK